MNATSKSRALLLGAVVAVTTPALAYYYYAPVAEEEEVTAEHDSALRVPHDVVIGGVSGRRKQLQA